MKQIHHIQEGFRNRHELDSESGTIKMRRESVMTRSDIDRIVHPEHGTFEIQPDGTFLVPDEVAIERLGDGQRRYGMPGWYDGPNPFFEEDDDIAPPAPKRRARSAA